MFTKFFSGLVEVLKNPVSRYCTLASVARTITIYTNVYFLPAFFLLAYPSERMTFSWAKCLISVFGGMCGNVISGMISDKYS